MHSGRVGGEERMKCYCLATIQWNAQTTECFQNCAAARTGGEQEKQKANDAHDARARAEHHWLQPVFAAETTHKLLLEAALTNRLGLLILHNSGSDDEH